MNRLEKLVASRYVPQGANAVRSKKSASVVYLWSSQISGRPQAMGYSGNAGKPAFHYTFKDAGRRSQYIADWLKQQDEAAARRAARVAEQRAKAKQPHKLQVGDVLKSMWGYDQTNVEYFEVTALIGDRMVEIREIACESVETGFMQGKSVPAKGQYIGEPMRKRVSEAGNSVRVHSFASASLMEPMKVAGVPVGYQPSHWTAYH